MSVHTEYKAKKYLLFKMNQIREDGESYMKSVAPHRTGRSSGKGSMSTGALRKSIKGVRTGIWTVLIAPNVPYAWYADRGRGSITVSGHPMKFIGADGNLHIAYHVGPMEGWGFEAKTAAYLRGKYG